MTSSKKFFEREEELTECKECDKIIRVENAYPVHYISPASYHGDSDDKELYFYCKKHRKKYSVKYKKRRGNRYFTELPFKIDGQTCLKEIEHDEK